MPRSRPVPGSGLFPHSSDICPIWRLVRLGSGQHRRLLPEVLCPPSLNHMCGGRRCNTSRRCQCLPSQPIPCRPKSQQHHRLCGRHTLLQCVAPDVRRPLASTAGVVWPRLYLLNSSLPGARCCLLSPLGTLQPDPFSNVGSSSISISSDHLSIAQLSDAVSYGNHPDVTRFSGRPGRRPAHYSAYCHQTSLLSAP